jgi:protein-S-isoprenylcysteine O-methyltransferase Ste14
VYFSAAGVLLVASWLLYFLLLHNPLFPWLVYVGWAILGMGLLLMPIAMVTLRRKGQPKAEDDFTRTTTVVDTGIYAVVRHPLYLGWLLMYVAVILFSQHWLIAIMGILGIVCMALISRDEDQRLVGKFGDPYRAYIESVPAMNILVGLFRRLR